MYSETEIRESLLAFCCSAAAFMWEHRLLAPRVETDLTAGTGALWMTFLKGFRVRRTFMLLSRDQVLYECPFCRASWVLALGYRDHQHGTEARIVFSRVPQGPYERVRRSMPRSLLLQALAETKRRCKHWPPED